MRRSDENDSLILFTMLQNIEIRKGVKNLINIVGILFKNTRVNNQFVKYLLGCLYLSEVINVWRNRSISFTIPIDTIIVIGIVIRWCH